MFGRCSSCRRFLSSSRGDVDEGGGWSLLILSGREGGRKRGRGAGGGVFWSCSVSFIAVVRGGSSRRTNVGEERGRRRRRRRKKSAGVGGGRE